MFNQVATEPAIDPELAVEWIDPGGAWPSPLGESVSPVVKRVSSGFVKDLGGQISFLPFALYKRIMSPDVRQRCVRIVAKVMLGGQN